jgi:hypothetical protein
MKASPTRSRAQSANIVQATSAPLPQPAALDTALVSRLVQFVDRSAAGALDQPAAALAGALANLIETILASAPSVVDIGLEDDRPARAASSAASRASSSAAGRS